MTHFGKKKLVLNEKGKFKFYILYWQSCALPHLLLRKSLIICCNFLPVNTVKLLIRCNKPQKALLCYPVDYSHYTHTHPLPTSGRWSDGPQCTPNTTPSGIVKDSCQMLSWQVYFLAVNMIHKYFSVNTATVIHMVNKPSCFSNIAEVSNWSVHVAAKRLQ